MHLHSTQSTLLLFDHSIPSTLALNDWTKPRLQYGIMWCLYLIHSTQICYKTQPMHLKRFQIKCHFVNTCITKSRRIHTSLFWHGLTQHDPNMNLTWPMYTDLQEWSHLFPCSILYIFTIDGKDVVTSHQGTLGMSSPAPQNHGDHDPLAGPRNHDNNSGKFVCQKHRGQFQLFTHHKLQASDLRFLKLFLTKNTSILVIITNNDNYISIVHISCPHGN